MSTIKRILLATSHSGNLAIYCITSKKFRTVLGQKLFGIFHKNELNNQADNMQLTTYISSAKLTEQQNI
jgi:hypothetical protein